MAKYMLALPVEVNEWVDIREELPRIRLILAAWADPDEMIFGEPSIELGTDSGGAHDHAAPAGHHGPVDR